MVRKQPRNEKGQFASYASMPAACRGSAGESSKRRRERILLDSDSDTDLGPQALDRKLASALKFSGDISKSAGAGPNLGKQKEAARSPEQLIEVSSETEYQDDSDEVETMMDAFDERFAKAEKKMCAGVEKKPTKYKRIIEHGLEWLYHEVVDVMLKGKTKQEKKAKKN